jgi:hypothetical protein
MAEEFLPDSKTQSSVQIPSRHTTGDREPIRILISGSRLGIRTIIYTLHCLGFAQVHEWSQPQIDPQNGRFLSILTKFIARQ